MLLNRSYLIIFLQMTIFIKDLNDLEVIKLLLANDSTITMLATAKFLQNALTIRSRAPQTKQLGTLCTYTGDGIYECYMDTNDFIHVCYLKIVYIMYIYVCGTKNKLNYSIAAAAAAVYY